VKRAAIAREASAWREQETEKRAAVQRATGLIRPGVVVGLGSGIIAVFRTDQGSWILDAGFGPIKDSASVAASLLSRAAIAEVGLSCGLANDLIVPTFDGVGHQKQPRP
jgi:ribose 5-phosphate isomerase